MTNQLKEVLQAANISATAAEMDNIEAVISRCKDKNLNSSTAAGLICRDLDLDDAGTFGTLKKELINKGIFKN